MVCFICVRLSKDGETAGERYARSRISMNGSLGYGLSRNDSLFDDGSGAGRHNDYRAFPEIDGAATRQNPQTRT